MPLSRIRKEAGARPQRSPAPLSLLPMLDLGQGGIAKAEFIDRGTPRYDEASCGPRTRARR